MMKGNTIKLFVIPTYLTDSIVGFSIGRKSVKQGALALIKHNGDCSKHIHICNIVY